jgi:hypothetical protein
MVGMKLVIVKRPRAKCPYCGHVNILAEESDHCEHQYEVIMEDDEIYFYFYEED